MRPELQAWLDGEIGREDLPAEARATADRWEALLEALAASAPCAAPAWLEAGVMRELRERPHHSRLPAWVQWLLRPRPLPVPPLAAGLAAALLAFVLLRPWTGALRQESGPTADPVVYVQFVVEAPGARSVALAGDFSAWRPAVALQDPEGDGIWSARVPLGPGVHEYMFVLDGDRWVTDPHASHYAEDGFGNRNAVVAVAAPLGGA